MSEYESPDILVPFYRELISGCHILHLHRILDAYGHISVRHPTRPDVFLMPRNVAPANVKLPADIIQYYVHDASPIDSESPPGYVERFIHSEVYKKYPDVKSVVHSHSPDVLPFAITNVPLRACCHMSGFLGNSVPMFDIADYYREGDVHDLLIRNGRLGKDLSECFFTSTQSAVKPVVLMRGHGFTAVGGSIQESVFRAIYTAENARTQTTALALNQSMGLRDNGDAQELHYLRESELLPATEMGQWSCTRPWNLWLREVEAIALYVNLA